MFDNILGNTNNKNILIKTIETNKVSHSYIFSGPEGIGKSLFAKEFAKAILCENLQTKPCNKCKSCIGIDNYNNPDFFIIDNKEESIKTEQIKNLTKDVMEKPLNNSIKIYIINNSENMTREAQNALLKTLEEPPEYIVIILITTNANLLLNTIRSRCIKIQFLGLSDDELKRYFDEKITEETLKIAEGSITRALKVKDKEEIYKEINMKIANIENINELELLKLKTTIFINKDETNNILEYINVIFLNLILKDSKKASKYNKCIRIVEDTKNRLNRNGNYDMTIDNCLLSLWEEING